MCKQTPLSIKHTYTGIPFALTSEARLSANGTSMKVNVAWDTGSNVSSVSANVIDMLSLPPIGASNVSSGSGLVRAYLFHVDIDLCNGLVFRDVTVQSVNLSGSGIDALIGLDIITQGKFCVNSRRGKTTMTFRLVDR